jgi:cell division transport system permease protein
MSIFATFWFRVPTAANDAELGTDVPVKAETYVVDHESALRPDRPLVPVASIAGRALITVIAIMTFLASVTAGAAILIADASRGWQDQVAQEITIQIRPTENRDLGLDIEKALGIARQTPGIAHVHAISKEESEALLQPWLGAGLDLSELPVPRLIVVELDRSQRLDTQALQKSLLEKIPRVSVDDHRLWLERLAIMAQSVVAAAIVVFLLVLTAMGLAVGFATQGAMVGNREIIEVLHFIGAADHYISRQFQRHFFLLGLRGGAIGGALAILLFLLSGTLMSWMRATPSGDQMEVMFGSFALSTEGYIFIILIAAGIALLTGFVSRIIVFRHLRELN